MRTVAYRLLALDVDGTLLDGASHLRPSVIAAVTRAAEAGLRPVLCTGRRYRRARPIAMELGLNAPVVCNSGALVKDPSDHRTLWRADLDRDVIRAILELFHRHGEPVVSFTDDDPALPDFWVEAYPTARPLFDEFVGLNLPHAGITRGWTRLEIAKPHYHLCAIGKRQDMLALETVVQEALGNRVQTFVQKSPRYSGTMCEVIRHDANKWSAVLHVAEQWGIAPAEIIAVGDDMNDLPMIAGAGLGVAMGHAPEAVRAVADLVIGDHDSDSLTSLIDDLLRDLPESRTEA